MEEFYISYWESPTGKDIIQVVGTTQEEAVEWATQWEDEIVMKVVLL